MLDFGALPPEINSARMYVGPGSSPMVAAASAWEQLGAQLESYAAGYSATLAELRGQAWSGGAATAMGIAVEPYVAWAVTTAAQAEQAAAQARAAAAAYEVAFAATVPPHMVATNRIQLSTLIATNFFGQNAAAIAATEAAYAEMWAQDATAMYGYAASSSAATTLTPFNPPPRTANVQARPVQAAAVNRAATTSAGQARTLVSGLSTNTSSVDPAGTPAPASGGSSLIGSVSDFNTVIGTPGQTFMAGPRTFFGWEQFGYGLDLSDIQAGKAAVGTLPIVPDIAAVRGPALGSVGRATFVGKLSVPQAWVAASPSPPTGDSVVLSDNVFRTVSAAAPNSETGLGTVPGLRAADRATGVPVLRNGRRSFRMPRPAYGG